MIFYEKVYNRILYIYFLFNEKKQSYYRVIEYFYLIRQKWTARLEIYAIKI